MHHAEPTDSQATQSQVPQGSGSGSAPSTAANEHYQLDRFRLALLQQTPRPVFTILLVLANVAVYVLMVAKGVPPLFPQPLVLIEWGANFAPRTLDGEWWRLFTSMFLHYGAVHIGMNMLALWNLGRFVERLFGNVGFFLLYMLSGVAGSLASVAWNPVAPSAGASGAIFGVAGALLGGCWKLRRSMPPAFLSSARSVGINVLVLFAIFAGVNRFQNTVMVDNMAHLAGFITGLLCGLVLAEPIPSPSRSRKLRKNLGVAVLGTAALLLAVKSLPGKPTDVIGLLSEYNRVEKQVVRKMASADGRRRAGAMSPDEYVTFLEQDVLPVWNELDQKFAAAKNVPPAQQKRIADLSQVITLRQTGWRLKIEAIREKDPQKAMQSQESLDRADEMIQRLNADSEAPRQE